MCAREADFCDFCEYCHVHRVPVCESVYVCVREGHSMCLSRRGKGMYRREGIFNFACYQIL